MCLDGMQHEKLLFYISLSFCFWVRSRFCFVFLVRGFVFRFRDLSFCFGFWVFDFACMLFFRVLHFYFRVLSVCFVLRASRKTFSFFKIVWFYFVFCGSDFHLVLPFWNLCFCFGFWFSFLGFVVCIFLIGHHIFDRRLSVNLSTRGNLTRLSISWQSSQIGKRLNYLRI